MAGLVEHDDPRLSRPVQTADLAAPDTQTAIQVLTQWLARGGPPVISAPSLGMPLNILACRIQSQVVCLLNPRITAVDGIGWNHDERFVLTGPLRRDVLRARRLSVEGMRDSGQSATITCEGETAVLVQQQMELLAGQLPAHWMTRFDRLALARQPAPGSQPFLHGLIAGLCRGGATPASGVSDDDQPAAADPASGGGARLYHDAGALVRIGLPGPQGQTRDLLRLDRRDPLVPCGAPARHVLCLALGVVQSQVLVLGAGLLDVVLALRHAAPQAAVALQDAPGHLQGGLLGRLGLRPGPGLSLHGGTLAETEKAIGRAGAEAILADADMPDTDLGFDLCDATALRRLSRMTQGRAGLCIIAAAARRPELERALKTVFVHVERHDTAGAGVVYLAAKKVFQRETIRARAFTAIQRLGLPPVAGVLAARALVLSKDGKDRD